MLHSREVGARLGKPVRVDQFSLKELQEIFHVSEQDKDLGVMLLLDALKVW